MMNKIKLHQKYEWNCGDFVDDIRDTIIQVRQSGIRVKKPDFFPSLVAMRNTPIVWDKKKEQKAEANPEVFQNTVQGQKLLAEQMMIYIQMQEKKIN